MTYFDRVPMAWRPLVEYARSLLPAKVAETVSPRFLIGVSPLFVGLHDAELTGEYAYLKDNGWSYDTLAHANLAFHSCDERQTVVFPQPQRYSRPVETLIHEIGHCFDEATEFSLDCPITTAYSEVTRQERVAEAFEIIVRPPSGAWSDYVAAEAFRPLRDAMGVG